MKQLTGSCRDSVVQAVCSLPQSRETLLQQDALLGVNCGRLPGSQAEQGCVHFVHAIAEAAKPAGRPRLAQAVGARTVAGSGSRRPRAAVDMAAARLGQHLVVTAMVPAASGA